MGLYFRMLASLTIYKEALMKTWGWDKAEDYYKFLQENILDFAKVQVEFDNLKKYLTEFVDGHFTDKEIFEVLARVCEFNSIEINGGSEIKELDKLNEYFESLVSLIAITLSKPLDWVMENMDNYQASVLAREIVNNRIKIMTDMRYSYHSDHADYIKYIYTLQGIKTISGEELMANPALLKEVH